MAIYKIEGDGTGRVRRLLAEVNKVNSVNGKNINLGSLNGEVVLTAGDIQLGINIADWGTAANTIYEMLNTLYLDAIGNVKQINGKGVVTGTRGLTLNSNEIKLSNVIGDWGTVNNSIQEMLTKIYNDSIKTVQSINKLPIDATLVNGLRNTTIYAKDINISRQINGWLMTGNHDLETILDEWDTRTYGYIKSVNDVTTDLYPAGTVIDGKPVGGLGTGNITITGKNITLYPIRPPTFEADGVTISDPGSPTGGGTVADAIDLLNSRTVVDGDDQILIWETETGPGNITLPGIKADVSIEFRDEYLYLVGKTVDNAVAEADPLKYFKVNPTAPNSKYKEIVSKIDLGLQSLLRYSATHKYKNSIWNPPLPAALTANASKYPELVNPQPLDVILVLGFNEGGTDTDGNTDPIGVTKYVVIKVTDLADIYTSGKGITIGEDNKVNITISGNSYSNLHFTNDDKLVFDVPECTTLAELDTKLAAGGQLRGYVGFVIVGENENRTEIA